MENIANVNIIFNANKFPMENITEGIVFMYF